MNRLIRELIENRRDATPEEVEQIIERMATAPPDRRALPVPRRLRGSNYLGRTLGARTDAFFRHLIQRVVDEQQWTWGPPRISTLAISRMPSVRLKRLERYAQEGRMTEDQLARYEELKKIVARNRPVIRRLQNS